MKSFAELAGLGRELSRQVRRRERERRVARQARSQVQADQDIVAQAFADVVPLKPHGRHVATAPAPVPVARQHEADEAAALLETLSDEIDIELLLDSDDKLGYRRPGIGSGVLRRLRQGEWSIKRQIDLHGLRVDQARAALGEFLAQAQRNEHRCVRIIHGKGLGSPNRQPVLKGKVHRWLIQYPDVLAFCEARPNDGGSGAVVVLLQVRAPRDPRRA